MDFAEYEVWSSTNTLWSGQEEFLKSTEKTLEYDSSCDKLVDEIIRQINNIEKKGFKPEFILMNAGNYEKLIVWLNARNDQSSQPPDKVFGCNVVVWDVPINYVNVRCKASIEWAYGEEIRK